MAKVSDWFKEEWMARIALANVVDGDLPITMEGVELWQIIYVEKNETAEPVEYWRDQSAFVEFILGTVEIEALVSGYNLPTYNVAGTLYGEAGEFWFTNFTKVTTFEEDTYRYIFIPEKARS